MCLSGVKSLVLRRCRLTSNAYERCGLLPIFLRVAAARTLLLLLLLFLPGSSRDRCVCRDDHIICDELVVLFNANPVRLFRT
jgi:hypothetical protein